MHQEISISELRQRFTYNAESGNLHWVKPPSGRSHDIMTPIAGSLRRDGRRVVIIRKIHYYAHRLVWAYVHGEFPEKFIDHINGDNQDNRIENLRLAEHGENMQNMRSARSDSSSGLIGVGRHRNKFISVIRLHGKKYHLGSFNTAQEAHEAYVRAKRAMHPFCTI